MIDFYLGSPEPSWLARAGVRLFVSHRRFLDRKTGRLRKTMPRAIAPWALDSGGFSEIHKYGEWRTTPRQYVAAVRRIAEEVGQLEWAAPQDWMCEPSMLAKTGLTIAEHQRRTVENYCELVQIWGDWDCPFMPVLQGWTVDDYLRCVDLYAGDNDISLCTDVVGLGSVCRRQGSTEIARLINTLQDRTWARLHGFGVKAGGLRRIHSLVVSADSMAWSSRARHSAPLPGCTHASGCQNCMTYALAWRERLLAGLDTPPGDRGQLALWEGAA